MDNYVIALDAMGGDHGPSVVVPAAVNAIKRHPNLQLILVGRQDELSHWLKKYHVINHAQISVRQAKDVVEMDESPSSALRYKKDSSMRVAINLVKEGKASACVSAGNTGALMATARFVLKTLPGIDRPAIIAELPTISGKTRVLDLGANVDSCAEHLFQFAVMGSVLASALDNNDRPRVGLLNIGEEEIKGNDQVKRTAHLLAEHDWINYIGYVEGDDIYKGSADVIVCDGFVGNVALKSSEGLAQLIGHYMRKAFEQNWMTKTAAFLSWPVLRMIKKRIDPSRYNGASMLGLNGIVVKSHGSADIRAFSYAIEEAIMEVKMNVPQLIGQQVADVLHEGILE